MIPHAINGKIQLFRHFFCPHQGIGGNEFENLILFQKHPHVCGEDGYETSCIKISGSFSSSLLVACKV